MESAYETELSFSSGRGLDFVIIGGSWDKMVDDFYEPSLFYLFGIDY